MGYFWPHLKKLLFLLWSHSKASGVESIPRSQLNIATTALVNAGESLRKPLALHTHTRTTASSHPPPHLLFCFIFKSRRTRRWCRLFISQGQRRRLVVLCVSFVYSREGGGLEKSSDLLYAYTESFFFDAELWKLCVRRNPDALDQVLTGFSHQLRKKKNSLMENDVITMG